jgi:hypothetical protein
VRARVCLCVHACVFVRVCAYARGCFAFVRACACVCVCVRAHREADEFLFPVELRAVRGRALAQLRVPADQRNTRTINSTSRYTLAVPY